MTDRELLEYAAKAAGYKMADVLPNYPMWREGYGIWNPLTDDGDALRLAVKLHLCIDTFNVDEEEHSVAWKTLATECRENHGGRPYAATRRSIVCAAAEIGKEME